MVTRAQRIKAIVKNPEPARGKSGTDPLDPWGAKAGIAEASEEELLRAYLKSRGINPDYVPRDTKIAHSKSSAYLSWRKNHEFREEVDKEDTITFDIPLLIRVLEYAREDAKTDMDLHKVTEKLISIRDKGTLTMADYDFIVKLKESVELDEAGNPCWKGYQMVGMKDKNGKKVPNCVPEETVKEAKTIQGTALDKFRQAAAERAKKHAEIEKKQSKDGSGMTSAIDRLQKHLNKEEIEQIDEISKTTLKSYRDKSMASLKNAKANRAAAEPGKDMSKGFADLHAKSDAIAKKRAKGLAGYLQRKHGMKPGYEDERKTANEEIELDEACSCETKKEWSKSARMIKALYKKKNMKEETYDWEKDDKAQTYGKKPNISEPKEGQNFGENKPEARIVMKGGKTMTGEKRDTVEVDPLMKKPKTNAPDEFDKPLGKKDK